MRIDASLPTRAAKPFQTDLPDVYGPIEAILRNAEHVGIFGILPSLNRRASRIKDDVTELVVHRYAGADHAIVADAIDTDHERAIFGDGDRVADLLGNVDE